MSRVVAVLMRSLLLVPLAPLALHAAEPAAKSPPRQQPADAAKPAGTPKPPDRRELWVPADKVARVLGSKAMLLTREQYETLLRDAGVEKPPKPDAPAAVILSGASYRAVPDGTTAAVHANLTVNVLRDGWVELPLDFPGAATGAVTLDGGTVLAPGDVRPAVDKQQNPVRVPAMLILRGRGEHRVGIELTSPIQNAAGLSSVALTVPGAAAGTFTLTLPGGSTVEKSPQAVKLVTGPDRLEAVIALSPAPQRVDLSWKSAAAAATSRAPIGVQAGVTALIDPERIAAAYSMKLDSALGDLPETLEFVFAPAVKVLDVRAVELRGWDAADGRISVKLQPGARRATEVFLRIELPSLAGRDEGAVVVPLPAMQGVPRVEGLLTLRATEDVVVKEVTTDASLQRVPDGKSAPAAFSAVYAFSGRSAGLPVVVQRARPQVEADVDSLVEFRAEGIRVTRTITLREKEGHAFSTTITLPPGEELIEVRRLDLPGGEVEPGWSMTDRTVLVKWSDGSAKARTFRLRTRIDPEKWAQLPPEGVAFTLGDAKVGGAGKVTGYIALVADEAFRLEAQAGETLERRDGRVTPVRGDYAWFRRDTFDLAVKIQRRPAEVLAALTGYALPLEGLLDLRASMNYQFLGGGTRSVRIRVPKELAQDFHFDGPGIAERSLADDVWTITFQKELTGAYALGITAQAPIARQAAAGDAIGKGYSFAVKVPVISPLDVVRASGLWAIEANTETEIRFDAPGMNENDTLLAPQIPGYAPRHRVIGVFGWLGTDYALTLNGVRHAAAPMLAAVVDRLELSTVVSTSGLHRHEAIYRMRAAGVEYLDVALPPGATLLSVAMDGIAVKPVANRPGTVRLPLPAKRDTDAGVAATFVYETPAAAWNRRGRLELAAPSIAAGIPVLRSTWRVWVPEGWSFSDIESNLPVPMAKVDELLLRRIVSMPLSLLSAPLSAARTPAEPATREGAVAKALPGQSVSPISGKLRTIVFPQIDFVEATVPEIAAHLTERSKQLDPDGEGVNVVFSGGPAAGEMSRVTLKLSDVPMLEVIRYVSNLANLRYRIDASSVSLAPLGSLSEELLIKEWKVPPELLRGGDGISDTTSLGVQGNASAGAKDFLAASGVSFGQGAFAMYSPASGTLVVKGTQDQLDLIDRIIAQSGGKQRAELGKAIPAMLAGEASLADPGGRKTAGLLPLKLDLPKTGPALVFEGLYEPERLAMDYEDWWSRAKHLWLWCVGGAIAFHVFAGRRPWLGTMWALLLLSAVPLCVSPEWTPVCNALLGGWLAGLLLDRIGAWCVFRTRKEVPA